MKRKLDNKNIKLILSALVVVVLVIPLCFLKNKKNDEVVSNDDRDVYAHTSEYIIKEETIQNLKISNITMMTDNGYTTFVADVTNTSTEISNIENIDIELKDKKGDVVVTLMGNIGPDLKPNESRTISATMKGRYKNIVSKTISEHLS